MTLSGDTGKVVLALLAVALVFALPRLWTPGVGGLLRDVRWRREEDRWRRGGGPDEVSRSYWTAREMRRDGERLSALGYVVADQHSELAPAPDEAPVVSVRMTHMRLRPRRRTGGPQFFVTYTRRPR